MELYSYNFNHFIVLPKLRSKDSTLNSTTPVYILPMVLSISLMLFSKRQCYPHPSTLFPWLRCISRNWGLWMDGYRKMYSRGGSALESSSFQQWISEIGVHTRDQCALPQSTSHSCVSAAHPHSASFYAFLHFFQWERRKGWIRCHRVITTMSHGACSDVSLKFLVCYKEENI